MDHHQPTLVSSPNSPQAQVVKVAEADFPSEFGHFRIFGFLEVPQKTEDAGQVPKIGEEAVALVMGDLSGPEPPLLRIHSRCLTGDVFHSLRCDCRAQLEIALEAIAVAGRGLLIYEDQEGRGIGLLNKLRAYELQDLGADTVEANEQLGFAPDLRGYHVPAAIVRHFGIPSVRLLSNNPEKIQALENAGVKVVERIPIIARPEASRAGYLSTKRQKMGHLFP